MDIKRGDIFYIESFYPPPTGSEQASGRPAIKEKNRLPTHITIKSSPKVSTALCEQVNSVSKDRVGSQCGHCTEEEMRQVNAALMISLALDSAQINDDNQIFYSNKVIYEPSLDECEVAALRAELSTYKNLYEKLLNRLLRHKEEINL